MFNSTIKFIQFLYFHDNRKRKIHYVGQYLMCLHPVSFVLRQKIRIKMSLLFLSLHILILVSYNGRSSAFVPPSTCLSSSVIIKKKRKKILLNKIVHVSGVENVSEEDNIERKFLFFFFYALPNREKFFSNLHWNKKRKFFLFEKMLKGGGRREKIQ